MKIIKDLPYNEYAKMDGLSNSMLSKLAVSPAYYKYYIENPHQKTEALIFGSLLHGLVLEPDNFERDFIVRPNLDRRTKLGKELAEQFDLACGDKQVVTQEQFDLACFLKEKLLSHEIANKLLTGKGDNEISLFWEDEKTGIACKGKLDRIKNNIIIDLKTTASAGVEEFGRSAYKYGYHRQCYWYSNGFKQCYGKEPTGFIFIAIEKEPPYDIVVYGTTEIFKQVGEIEAIKLLETYKDCLTTNNWYGKEGEKPKVIPLDLPQSILNKYVDELDFLRC